MSMFFYRKGTLARFSPWLSYQERAGKRFLTLNDLFEKAALKGQTAKPTHIVKKGKPVLRQWQLKTLCKMSPKDQTFLFKKVGLAGLAFERPLKWL